MLDFLRPSSIEAIEWCPGRAAMEARVTAAVPALRDMCTEAARQGTLGHEVLASTIREAFTGDWSHAPQVIALVEGRMSGLEYWCKDAIRACLTYSLGLINRLAASYRLEILVERSLDGLCIAMPKGGTADLIILCCNNVGRCLRVVVLDHKLGFLTQGEAADHLQLGAYAAMAGARWNPPDGVEVHLSMGRRREFSSALYQSAELAAITHRIRAAVTAATSPTPTLRPSLKGCRYCRALPLCKAAREYLMHAAEEHALLGTDPAERIRLADDAALAKRFAASADALAKHWREQRPTTTETEKDSSCPNTPSASPN